MKILVAYDGSERANAANDDLFVVILWNGMDRIERFPLGSVSSAVAPRAHCSVEVVCDLKER